MDAQEKFELIEEKFGQIQELKQEIFDLLSDDPDEEEEITPPKKTRKKKQISKNGVDSKPDSLEKKVVNGQRMCAIPGCDRNHFCKNMCTLHYTRSKSGKKIVLEEGMIEKQRDFHCFDCAKDFTSNLSVLDATCSHCGSARVDHQK